MHYISTRGGMQPLSYTQVLLEGLAPDGGLAVPSEMPRVTAEQRESWRQLTYPQLATEILSLFADDIPTEDLSKMCHSAYNEQVFSSTDIVPLTHISADITLVALSEGPTLAFKDMAMQYLGHVLEYALEKHESVLNIVGATSGDTGSAAEYALRNKRGIGVFMLSPQGRMSDVQRAQMYSLTDANIHNIAIEGVFDDCQNLLKAVSADLAFKDSQHLGTVNSINLGRISAQVVYYFWAWLRMTDEVPASQRADTQVSFTVPSGNFGNILSGHYARQMGLPIHRLVLAANENNVLDEFFRTGVYRPRSADHTYATSSPSMDISKASNLERFIYDLLGADAAALAAAWNTLDETGELDLSAHQHRFESEFAIVSETSTHDNRVHTIREVYDESSVIIDPHTADGVTAAKRHLTPNIAMLVLETAKPQKFPDIVEEAIGHTAPVPAYLAEMMQLPQRVTNMPNSVELLREFIVSHAVSAEHLGS